MGVLPVARVGDPVVGAAAHYIPDPSLSKLIPLTYPVSGTILLSPTQVPPLPGGAPMFVGGQPIALEGSSGAAPYVHVPLTTTLGEIGVPELVDPPPYGPFKVTSTHATSPVWINGLKPHVMTDTTQHGHDIATVITAAGGAPIPASLRTLAVGTITAGWPLWPL